MADKKRESHLFQRLKEGFCPGIPDMLRVLTAEGIRRDLVSDTVPP